MLINEYCIFKGNFCFELNVLQCASWWEMSIKNRHFDLPLSTVGDDETITGVLDDSVLLPCTCPERNLDKEFKWQMEEPNMMLVLKHNSPASVFYGRYRGRARVLLDESSRNCSLLLTNITADDVGKYRCVFYSQGKYKKFFVNLNISGKPLIYYAYLQNLTIHKFTVKQQL